MKQEEIIFLNSYCFDDVYKDLNEPQIQKTMWVATKPFYMNNEWFDNEYDLKVYMDREIDDRNDYLEKQKEGTFEGNLFDTLISGITRYDYIGDYAGESEVFKKSLLTYTEEGFISTYVSFENKSKDGEYIRILKENNGNYFWQDFIFFNIINELYEEFGIESSKTKSLCLKK